MTWYFLVILCSKTTKIPHLTLLTLGQENHNGVIWLTNRTWLTWLLRLLLIWVPDTFEHLEERWCLTVVKGANGIHSVSCFPWNFMYFKYLGMINLKQCKKFSKDIFLVDVAPKSSAWYLKNFVLRYFQVKGRTIRASPRQSVAGSLPHRSPGTEATEGL